MKTTLKLTMIFPVLWVISWLYFYSGILYEPEFSDKHFLFIVYPAMFSHFIGLIISTILIMKLDFNKLYKGVLLIINSIVLALNIYSPFDFEKYPLLFLLPVYLLIIVSIITIKIYNNNEYKTKFNK